MIERISGYDPDTGICWQFGNKGDQHWRCKCPVCSTPRSTLIRFGRCRSGQRWFWKATNFTLTSDRHYQTSVWEEVEEHGFEDTETEAWIKIRAAVIGLAGNRPAIAHAIHSIASDELKELNAAKRRARPPSNAKGSKVVEYLYGYSHVSDYPNLYRFRITKKTAKRVYYIRGGERIDERGNPRDSTITSTSTDDDVIGYVNRQKLEADGEVSNRGVHWCRPDSDLHSSLESLLRDNDRGQRDEPDLHQLKAEMAAAHPDRGGSSAAFIEARARYVAARRRMRSAGTAP